MVCYMLTAQLYFIMGGRFLKLREVRILCKRRILSETYTDTVYKQLWNYTI